MCFVFVLKIILSWEVDVHESQGTSVIVWRAKSALRRLCQTQDLIWIVHPFTNLVYESFNYLQISLYIYSVFVYCFCLSILFVLLLIVKSVFCSFCFITKVNCCNISNSLLLGFGTIFGGVYKGSFRIDFLGFGSYFFVFFFFFGCIFWLFSMRFWVFFCADFLVGFLCDCSRVFF